MNSLFNINPDTKVPKYKQIAENVISALKSGELQVDDPLPSINKTYRQCGLARETVIKAYQLLKEMGFITAVHGKGYYIRYQREQPQKRVFLLFDVMNPYKELLYSKITKESNKNIHIDTFFHHFNAELFETLVKGNKDLYDDFIIMPFEDERVNSSLRLLPQEKLLLLDVDYSFTGKDCSSITQNFNEALQQALEKAYYRLDKYQQLTLIFPEDRHHPPAIKEGFSNFCRNFGLDGHIVEKCPQTFTKGQVYFVIEDDDLIQIVENTRRSKLTLGEDVGLISYNDTPFKRIIQPGISVISTDFSSLGSHVADYLNEPKKTVLQVKTQAILRGSL